MRPGTVNRYPNSRPYLPLNPWVFFEDAIFTMLGGSRHSPWGSQRAVESERMLLSAGFYIMGNLQLCRNPTFPGDHHGNRVLLWILGFIVFLCLLFFFFLPVSFVFWWCSSVPLLHVAGVGPQHMKPLSNWWLMANWWNILWLTCNSICIKLCWHT